MAGRRINLFPFGMNCGILRKAVPTQQPAQRKMDQKSRANQRTTNQITSKAITRKATFPRPDLTFYNRK